MVKDAAWTSCGLAAWGVVRIAWGEISRWRKNPGRADGLTTSKLKLADEQTVLAMAAVLQATERAGWAPTSFGEWGVLAAPKYMARPRIAHALQQFRAQGVLGVSPLIIPCLSQHAVAATVCLILGCHGPNFGVSGGSTPMVELLLNSLSVFAGQPCPGVWALMTAWEPESIPDSAGQVLSPTTGIGVALALTPDVTAGEIRLVRPSRLERETPPQLSLGALANFLEQPGTDATWHCPIPGGGYMEVLPNRGAPLSLPLRLAS